MDIKPGDIVEFKTTQSDMAVLNGCECVVLSKDLDGTYSVRIIDPVVTAFEDELFPIEA